MAPRYAVRPGGSGEIEECIALALLANPDRSVDEWRDALSRDAENPEHLLVVAESERAIVGYGRARLFEPDAEAPADTVPAGYYLSGLFVMPDLRRSGIGLALTEARLGWIRPRATEAWYFANSRNAGSIELHRRLGFEEISRRSSFPGVTFEGGEGILFRLPLDPV